MKLISISQVQSLELIDILSRKLVIPLMVLLQSCEPFKTRANLNTTMTEICRVISRLHLLRKSLQILPSTLNLKPKEVTVLLPGLSVAFWPDILKGIGYKTSSIIKGILLDPMSKLKKIRCILTGGKLGTVLFPVRF